MLRSLLTEQNLVEMPADEVEVSSPTGSDGTTVNGNSLKKLRTSAAQYHTPGSNMKLIKLVRKEPCLWDPRHVQYRDSAKKDKCWEEIARQVNMQIGHARQRWKSLRDTFTKKVRKIAIIEAAGGYTGSGEDPCQWKYFTQLKFLENVIHTQRPRLVPAPNIKAFPVPTIQPMTDCDLEEDEEAGPQRAWPLTDERELIHYMRDYPVLWNKRDPSYNNDASKDMAIIQIHTNFQERYTWSEIQNKITSLVKKYAEGDTSWIHQESLTYITNGVCKLEVDSDDADVDDLLPHIEMEEGDETVKSVTVTTTTSSDGSPTVKVISTSSSTGTTGTLQQQQAKTNSSAPTFTIQSIPNLSNGQDNPSPIKIITMTPNSGQNFAIGGTATNGGTILIPGTGQNILQMLQAQQKSQDLKISSLEKRIDNFATWIKAYLRMVDPDDLDRIELEIHELMVTHTKKKSKPSDAVKSEPLEVTF